MEKDQKEDDNDLVGMDLPPLPLDVPEPLEGDFDESWGDDELDDNNIKDDQKETLGESKSAPSPHFD